MSTLDSRHRVLTIIPIACTWNTDTLVDRRTIKRNNNNNKTKKTNGRYNSHNTEKIWCSCLL